MPDNAKLGVRCQPCLFFALICSALIGVRNRHRTVRIFLIGGTGFIGQALVRAMRRHGWAVDAQVREPGARSAQWLSQQCCKLVRGDVTERGGLAQSMAGADVLLHTAGIYDFAPTTSEQARMKRVNVNGTDNVLGAAFEAGIPRTVYVSTAWALGPSGYPPEEAVPRDESHSHSGSYLTAYERSKVQAHGVALAWRDKGLPLVIAMPNGVVGANDHSIFGYFLRLYLLRAMPPICFAADTVVSLVSVNALAEGLCAAAVKAGAGEDYLFCGEPTSVRDLFEIWSRHPGAMVPRLWLPRALMRWPLAAIEPLQRVLGYPAVLSRYAVDVSRAHLNYSAAKARRDLGWSHPGPIEMWDDIIRTERELMARRRGFRDKLRPQQL